MNKKLIVAAIIALLFYSGFAD